MEIPRRCRLPKTLSKSLLRDTIQSFCLHNIKYANPNGAFRHCYVATEEFRDYLHSRTQNFDIVSKVRTMLFCKNEHECDLLGLGWVKDQEAHDTDDYPLDRSHLDLVDHRVVQVGNLYIDFTARQFNEEAPFPLMWVRP